MVGSRWESNQGWGSGRVQPSRARWCLWAPWQAPLNPTGALEVKTLSEPCSGSLHMRWEDTKVWPEEPMVAKVPGAVRRIQ